MADNNTSIQNLRINLTIDQTQLRRDISNAQTEVRRLQTIVDSAGANATEAQRQALQGAQRHLQSLLNTQQDVANSFTRIADSAHKAGVAMSAIGAGIALIGKNAIEVASATEQMQSKMGIVFGDKTDSITKWTTEFGRAANRSKLDLQYMAVNAQDTLKPLGLMTDEAYELSKAIVKLSADISSFDDKNMNEVQANIISAMIGNTEAVRSYGVIMTETSMKAMQLKESMDMSSDTYGKSYDQLTELEKALLRFKVIQEGTTDAVDNAVITQDEYANVLEGTKGKIKDAKDALGKELMPIAKDVIKVVGDMAEAFSNLNSTDMKIIVALGALAIATGPVLLAIEGLARLWPLMVSGMDRVIARMGAIGASMGTTTISAQTLTNNINGATIALSAMSAMVTSTLGKIDQFNTTIGNAYNKSNETLIAEKDNLTKLITDYNKVTQALSDFGIQAEQVFTGQAAYVNFGLKAVGLTEDQKKQADALKKQMMAITTQIRAQYGNMETLMAIREKTIQAMKEEAEAGKVVESELVKQANAYKALMAAEADYMNQSTSNLVSLSDQKDLVVDLINSFENLSQKKERSVQEDAVLAGIMERVNQLTGQQILSQNAQTGAFNVNTDALNTYNSTLAQTIALAQDEIVVRIKTITETAEKDQREADFYELEAEYLTARKDQLISEGKYTSEQIEQEIKDNITKAETIKNSLDGAKNAAQDGQRELDNYLKKVANAFKVPTQEKKTGEDAATKYKNQIRDQLDAVKHQYDLNQIDQATYLKKLEDNLSKHTAFYKANASERRQIERDIFNVKENMKDSKITNQMDALDKAYDRQTQKIQDQRDLYEKAHNERLKQIKDAADARIKSIQDEIDKKRELINQEREEDRLARIEQEMEIYKNASTSEAMEYYMNLVREKEDIMLSRDEKAANATIESIEKIQDAAIKSAEEQHKANLLNLDNQSKAIEDSYSATSKAIQNITETQTKKMEELVNGYVKTLEEAAARIAQAQQTILKPFDSVIGYTLGQNAVNNTNTNNSNINISNNNNFNITAGTTGAAAHDTAQEFLDQLQKDMLYVVK